MRVDLPLVEIFRATAKVLKAVIQKFQRILIEIFFLLCSTNRKIYLIQFFMPRVSTEQCADFCPSGFDAVDVSPLAY